MDPTYDITSDWEPFMQAATATAIPEARSSFQNGASPALGTGFYTGANGKRYAVTAEYKGAAGQDFELRVREDT